MHSKEQGLKMKGHVKECKWCFQCLLVVEEVLYQFKLKIGKLNRDLLQPSGIRYEVRSFSVTCFLFLLHIGKD